jgi:UDP-2,3-diacylglucosamine pyrophosphatase LpxH
MKRTPNIVILSDTHLGTYGCHAKELLKYLKSIQPKTLILNGDIIDFWNFKKKNFPALHLDIIRRILKLSVSGTKVYYLTGNHDDLLRKFGEMSLGNIQLCNKLVFMMEGKKYWIFHGDVFDASVHKARWLARLGGEGYDLLIRINRNINRIRSIVGLKPVSFSAKVKKRVKNAVKFISDFEETAIELALENSYDYVVCGHIHQPSIRQVTSPDGRSVTYMNSGDWVEHLTALEYDHHKWSIFKFVNDEDELISPALKVEIPEPKVYALRREEVVPESNAILEVL